MMLIIFIAGVMMCDAMANSNVYNNGPARIIGGHDALDGEFPYVVSLRNARSYLHFCAGTIISNNWILTAAHCVLSASRNDIIVVAGTNYLNTGGTAFRLSQIIMHGSYNPATNVNDIALLNVDGDISTSSNVKNISLADSPPPANSTLVTSGWGASKVVSPNLLTNKLQTANLQSISLQQCQKELPSFPVYNTNICTQTIANKKGICRGDSGDPITWNGVLVGIVSWGIPCATGKPDVSTSVAAYRTWIRDISGV